jgi:glycosyltransferase involved in cell wall biosynthesis
LVSVVIPCYNQAHFLANAIESVRAQRYDPLELIVVDDGSTDDTSAVARGLGAILIRQPNRGQSVARNVGLRAAHGVFAIVLDADDELLPDAATTGVSVLLKHPGAICVVRLCQVMDEERRVVPSNPPVLASDDLYREWLLRNFTWTPGAAMFRRVPLLASGAFPASVSAAEDYAVFLRLARAGLVVRDPRNVVRYRQHRGNKSADPKLMLVATLEVLRREGRYVPPEYRDVFAAGVRNWRRYYGEQIAHQLRTDWRQGRRGLRQLRSAWILARHGGPLLWSHAVRKLSRVMRGQPPAELEPDRLTALAKRRAEG